MDELSILKLQIQFLLDQIRSLEGVLSTHEIDSALYKKARACLENEMQKRGCSLYDVQKKVEENQSLDSCWADFRGVREQCVQTFRECLAYLEGVLARGVHLDGDLCEIADAMLYELSGRLSIPWERFTILADGEFFADMAQIIRLRFPETTVWNLPLAGHEFGHFVGLRKEAIVSLGKQRFPFKDILDKEGKPSNVQEMRYLHEHFADIFATYTLGPAFACTCILLRFDPGTALLDGTHPAAAKRVHSMLEALRLMDEADRNFWKGYQSIAYILRDVWQKSLVATGHIQFLEEQYLLKQKEQLKDRFEGLYDLVRTEFPKARYAGWPRAIGLSAKLAVAGKEEVKLEDTDTIPDILNAAWQCRLGQLDRPCLSIGETAFALCRQVARRPL